MQEEKTPVNREYKDTVFRMLFNKKAHLLELYNGLNGTDYQNEEDLVIYTLDNAIYMGMKNDISFLLMSELNLYEHQSSYNPNMPLRDLIYIARQFERFVSGKSLYSKRRLKLPTPSFAVFYNGTDAQPERRVLRLSDSFETKTEEPSLELKVMQINVNEGNNQELLERCRTLKEYSQYVACVRKHIEKEPLEDAVDHAVAECIQKGILKDFLLSQRAEVIAMSIFEYDEEEEKRKLREAEFEYGREEGERVGERKGERKGQEKIMALMQRLFAQGRGSELERVVKDEAYLDQLLEEFGLKTGLPEEKEE